MSDEQRNDDRSSSLQRVHFDKNGMHNDGLSSSDKCELEPVDLKRYLSATSKQYDRHGKGYLDDTEKAMREFDTSNRGYLTNDRVYDLMKESVEMQKQMVTHKRLIVGLAVFTVILALANMATAFAAARLAKDTSVTSNNDLATKDGEERLGMTPKGHRYIFIQNEEANEERSLQAYGTAAFRQADAEAMYLDHISSIPVTMQWHCGMNNAHPISRQLDSLDVGNSRMFPNGLLYTFITPPRGLFGGGEIIEVDCPNDGTDCPARGFNCCRNTTDCTDLHGPDSDYHCAACECQCIKPGTFEGRCYSYCEGVPASVHPEPHGG